MPFEPLGKNLMVAAYETRIEDYEAFVQQTRREHPPQPDFEQGRDHPIVNVSREDAIAFCEWLTKKEREQQRIAQSHRYRLPTDIEWSRMANLESEIGDGPGQRDANKPEIYPWGTSWPPDDSFANYADNSASELPGVTPEQTILDYDDTFPRTSPAGAFEPNPNGFYDVSGNVHEWVQDDISSTFAGSLGVLRGGGWNTHIEENLYLGWRNPVPSTFASPYYGFRVVLSKVEIPEKPEGEF